MKATVYLLVLASCSVRLTSAHYHATPNAMDMITGVDASGGRVRRQGARETIRIVPVYDSSVELELQSKSEMIRTQTVPKLIEFFENSLTVNRVQGNLLFEQACTDQTFFRTTNLGTRGCSTTCSTTTTCGEVTIPTEHLKSCVECNGAGSQSCQRVGSDGAGVPAADVVLYISAVRTNCPSADNGGAQTVAFARACQMEADLDRPIVGNVNFCPLGVQGNAAEFILELAKHETTHALAFASGLFAFWRDGNGNPRTAREPGTNLPPNFNMAGGYYESSLATIRPNINYPSWLTINGAISHNVIHMVTPAVLREARAHFNCPTLAGVELENQGSVGTVLSHWEKRILGNEALTGQLTFNPVFSRISLAAFEDSGWYGVNYMMAQDLAWGRGAGCTFVMGTSCLEWINTQNSRQLPVAPFCTDTDRGCTVDHEAVSQCNLDTTNPPIDYQYFADRTSGGRVTIADYCPFQDRFRIQDSTNRVRGTDCSIPDNQPTVSFLSEVYGAQSRCIKHGDRQWTNSRVSGFSTGSGCYQYICNATTGVGIIVAGLLYQCECEGEQLQFSFTDSNGGRVMASLLCPACSQVCYDNLLNCPTPEPATCYGRITSVQGSTEIPVNVVTPPPNIGSGAQASAKVLSIILLAVLISLAAA